MSKDSFSRRSTAVSSSPISRWRTSRFERAGLVVFALLVTTITCVRAQDTRPSQRPLSESRPKTDWLLDPRPFAATFTPLENGEIRLSNGLVLRRFATGNGFATIAFDDLVNGKSLLRAVRPEARLTIDTKTFELGGSAPAPVENYLRPEWAITKKAADDEFRCVAIENFAAPGRESLAVTYSNAGLWATITYEIFDGLPLVSKRLKLVNRSGKTVHLDAVTVEILAVTETASVVDGENMDAFLPNMRPLHVVTEMSFGGSMDEGSSGPAVRWKTDPGYATQVSYEKKTPCLLECAPPVGPDIDLADGETFESFRVFELVQDSTDRERRGLAVRKMYRTLAPWALENPLIFHVLASDPARIRAAIDQAAEVGFELVLMTFGSGFDYESADPGYIAKYKELADYAHAKGIRLGGYSLLASRSISPEHDVLNPKTGKPGGFARFGNSPCLGSRWGREYFAHLRAFIEKAGLDALEHDGSYPGDVCASTNHPGHKGLGDSQWTQWKAITDFYAFCRGRGMTLNVPDWYYLNGSTKCGMGYRETNWSLPREEQEIIERQNVFDGTWTKTPSMGWMFVPLAEYHGGGARATIEPLADHLDHYDARLANLLGSGVQACYRGPRLFDSEKTKAVVKSRVEWFKAHRAILEADVIHGRRADARDVDWILHADPRGETKGMLVVWNPLAEPVTRTLDVDLYYTGITDRAHLTDAAANESDVTLDRRYRAPITVTVPSRGMTWVKMR